MTTPHTSSIFSHKKHKKLKITGNQFELFVLLG